MNDGNLEAQQKMEGERGEQSCMYAIPNRAEPYTGTARVFNGITLKLAIHMLVINKAKMYGQDYRL